MSGKITRLPIIHLRAACLLGLLLLLPGAAPSAQAAVTLSLKPATTTAAQGSVIQFMLFLTGGTNIGIYTTSISVNTSVLSFVNNSPPFTSTFSGANQFDQTQANNITTSGTTQTLNISYASGFGEQAVNNTDPNGIELGFFSALVSSSAPLGSSTASSVTFAPITTNNGGSSVQDADSGANLLTATSPSSVTVTAAAAPEPAQTVSLGLLALGLGGLLLRARKRRKLETP